MPLENEHITISSRKVSKSALEISLTHKHVVDLFGEIRTAFNRNKSASVYAIIYAQGKVMFRESIPVGWTDYKMSGVPYKIAVTDIQNALVAKVKRIGNYALDCTGESNQFSGKLTLRPSPEIRPIPNGLVSLSDMINFTLDQFMVTLRFIRGFYEDSLAKSEEDSATIVTEEEKRIFLDGFGTVFAIFRKMDLPTALHRVLHIQFLFSSGKALHSKLKQELEVLFEGIENDISAERFYHYPRAKGVLVQRVSSDWKETLMAFPSAKEDVLSAVDCYALAHNTASVFHSMRVAEYGLRALAKERGVKIIKKMSLEWSNWQDMLDAIEAEVGTLTRGHSALPRGPKRDAASEFYRGCLGEFASFKEEFRNNVMHSRKNYDEFQALRALTRVKEFMERLSLKTDEKGKRIRWS
jgi:hypothetical protein